MAAKVLTTAGTVTCPHGLAITFTSSASLHVGGAPVVRESDLSGPVITCAAEPKCVSIAPPPLVPQAPGTVLTSISQLLRVDGSPVVLVTKISTNMVSSSSGTPSIGTTTIIANHGLLQTE
jgi:hypothetical protein